MVLEWYAQSRRTMNSKPSEDMRVTYVEGSEIIIAACLWGDEWAPDCDEEDTEYIQWYGAWVQSAEGGADAIDVVSRDFDTY